MAAARELMDPSKAELIDREEAPGGGYALHGRVEAKPVEILVDGDQRIRRGACVCGHFKRYGLKNGPCRHMLALRWRAYASAYTAYTQSTWYNQLTTEG